MTEPAGSRPTVDDAGSRLTWSLWCYRSTVDHDGTGAPQTDESKASGAGGSTGRHRVTANLA